MKKILLFASITLISISANFSQTIVLYITDNTDVTGDTIIVTGFVNEAEIYAYVYVKNNTPDPLNIWCKKTIIDTVPGSVNTFCWGQCIAPSVDTAPNPVTIAPYDTNKTDFYGIYSPLGNIGATMIRYTFFLMGGDSSCVTVSYETIFGINETVHNNNYISSPRYNFENNTITLLYNIEENSTGYVSLYNILGSEFKRIYLNGNSGKISIDFNETPTGLYFYSFMVNNVVVRTGKLMGGL